MRAVGVSKTTVWRWQEYFAEAGVGGLIKGRSKPPGKKPLSEEVTSQDRREDDEGTSRQRHPLERPHDGGGDGRQPHQRAAHLE